MTETELTPYDEDLLSGHRGEAPRMAMRIILEMARVAGAQRLIDVRSAHIDGCLYHGRAGLDFAERLASVGGRVVVRATLNVGSLDLLHPALFRGDKETAHLARKLMDAYVAMGCEPTWTCAPYQLPERPGPGEHVAWAESNAIVFANSVLGARTDRYGDFIDICAAITGRVPDAGLHRTENRRGRVLFDLEDIPKRLLHEDVLYPVLGHLVGLEAGNEVPVFYGLPESTTEDQLKALGAAAASSGSVALFHAVGLTPEASSLDDALHGGKPIRSVRVLPEMLVRARDSLSSSTRRGLAAVSLGTPHFSVTEFGKLVPLLEEIGCVHPGVDLYVSTSRHVLSEIEERGWLPVCEEAGLRIVTDTCTYITPILRRKHGPVMTNSAKWAYYAPGNIGVEAVFGSLTECVRSAHVGEVWRDEGLWAGD
jgi:predicted aconitase